MASTANESLEKDAGQVQLLSQEMSELGESEDKNQVEEKSERGDTPDRRRRSKNLTIASSGRLRRR